MPPDKLVIPNLGPWAAVRRGLARTPRTRFAPSPTGFLHLGHLLHALYVWGCAVALGGEVIVRIEDHDRLRCKAQYERDMLETLDWLGLPYTSPPRNAWQKPTSYRQSDCHERYLETLAQLGDRVYACDCSRKTLAARIGPLAAGAEMPYDGFCRDRNLEDVPGTTLRLRAGEAPLSYQEGARSAELPNPLAACGDFALRDNKGLWTYQFCVVADDLHHGVNLVVRGQDLLPSTGRQLVLMRALGALETPVYIHHPLLADDTGEKLSKSRFSKSLHEWRLAGLSPAELCGMAAQRAGWSATQRPIEPGELLDAIDRAGT